LTEVEVGLKVDAGGYAKRRLHTVEREGLVESGAEERPGGETQLNTKVLDGGPTEDGVDGHVGTEGDTEDGGGGGWVRVRHVIADHSSKVTVGGVTEGGGVFNDADKLNSLERVGIVKLLVRMDNAGIGGDHPLVKEQVARADGSAGIVKADEGHRDSRAGPEEEGDGGHGVVDADRERCEAGKGGG
jgi:hypothetical protein